MERPPLAQPSFEDQREGTSELAEAPDMAKAALKKASGKASPKKVPRKAGPKKAPSKASPEKAPIKAGLKKAPSKAGLKKAPSKAGLKKAPSKAGLKKAPRKKASRARPGGDARTYGDDAYWEGRYARKLHGKQTADETDEWSPAGAFPFLVNLDPACTPLDGRHHTILKMPN